MSTVSRAIVNAGSSVVRSTARASSADGGPPCWAARSQGLVVATVDSKVSSPTGR